MNSNNILQKANYKMYPLKWDTDYFGISSGRLNITGKLNENEKEEILLYINKFRFITISNLENCSENNVWIGQQTTAFSTDINVQFKKNNLSRSKENNKNIKIENDFKNNLDILEIAETSFKYSRFFNDPYLPEKEKKNIYVEWIKSSFNKINKHFIYCYTDSGRVSGFILVDIDEKINTARIELIAVGKKYKGNKIGTKLIQELENYLVQRKINNMIVGTQINNINAVNFYVKNGFVYQSCQSIYHLWK